MVLIGMMSHYFNIHHGFEWQTRDGKVQNRTIKHLSKYNGKRIVIIDDINIQDNIQGIHDVVMGYGRQCWYITLFDKLIRNLVRGYCRT